MIIYLVVDEKVGSMENTSSSGRNSAMNTSLRDGLASDAGRGVEVGWVQSLVFVGHPGHFSLTSVHVWGRDVDGGSEEAVLVQLLGKGAGDSLQLGNGVSLRVKSDTGLSTTEWNVASSALPGHKSGEGLDLVHVDVGSVSHTALGRESVVRVLSSVAREDLVGTIIHSDSEVGLDDGLAGKHEVKDTFNGLRK